MCYSLQKVFENPTVDLSTLCNLCYSSELMRTFLCTGSIVQHATEQCVLCIHLSFVNFAFHPTLQTKI